MASLQQRVFWIAVAVAACAFTSSVNAQEFCTDFENYNAAPSGIPLTGQQAWYNPIAGSADFQAFTYITGNPYGIVDNPTGGLKFVAGRAPGNSVFARAQHDVAFTNAFWELGFDVCANYNGPAGAALNNIGSQSAPIAPNDYIILLSWVAGQEGTLMNIGYLVYDALGGGGGTLPPPGQQPPDPTQWSNLPLNHWFRLTMLINYPANKIDEVSIRDITAGGPVATYNPTDWYLEGGAAGSTTQTTAIRFFAGGNSEGNITAWDNFCIRPRGTTAVEPGTWGSIKARFDAPEGGSHKAMPVAANPEVQ